MWVVFFLFGFSFSGWGVEVGPSSLGRCWQFSERGLPLPFPVWGWPFLSGWPSLPWVGVGLLSRVMVGPSFLGEGWPFGSGLARPKGEGQPKRGEREGQGPAKRKGRGGAVLTQEQRRLEVGVRPSFLGRMGRLMIMVVIYKIDKFVLPTLGKGIGPSFSWVAFLG